MASNQRSFGTHLLKLCILFGVLGGLWFTWQGRQFYTTPLVVPAEGYVLTIPKGASVRWIAQSLAQQQILSRPLFWIALAYWNQVTNRLQAGEYLITPGMRPSELLWKLVRGEVIVYSMTLVEGWQFSQVADALQKAPKLKHTLDLTQTSAIMQALQHPGEHPEGQFCPDTYFYTADTTDRMLLQQAYNAQQAKLQHAWQQRAAQLPYKTPYEALIMASIIEKETADQREYTEVAGVYVRRLQRGMRLQADPTVRYGLNKTAQGILSYADLKIPTPYNTYLISGLPPTPIALPGIKAIEAALHPAPGTALYFVATGLGGHFFSSTLKEHQAAVRRYYQQRLKVEGAKTP